MRVEEVPPAPACSCASVPLTDHTHRKSCWAEGMCRPERWLSRSHEELKSVHCSGLSAVPCSRMTSHCGDTQKGQRRGPLGRKEFASH